LSGAPEIVLLTSDLVTQSRVEAAGRRCGALLRSVSDAESLIVKCVESSARLAIVDLTVASADLAAIVAELKSRQHSHPTVIAFGPHVHEARLAAAAQAGCDEVMSRGQFFAQLDSILARFVAPPN
jgi:DNA-binding NarL/FixJ family response regulator